MASPEFDWVKDPKIEFNLREMGIKFEEKRVPKRFIDWEEGLRRQKRLIGGKLNEDAVIQIAMDMQKPGARFPMIILQEPEIPKKKAGTFEELQKYMWVWSGNHRGAGHNLAFGEDGEIKAYCVCVKDPVMMDFLPRKVNCWESMLGYSKEERVESARYMIATHGMSAQQAADEFGIKVNSIYRKNASSEAKIMIQDIPGCQGLSDSLLGRLHTLADNKNVIRAAGKVLGEYKVAWNEARAMIDDIRKQPNEIQMLSEIGRWEKIFEARKSPKKKKTDGTVKMNRSNREHLFRNLQGMEKLLADNHTVTKLQITDPGDLRRFDTLWTSIVKNMDRLLEDIKKFSMQNK